MTTKVIAPAQTIKLLPRLNSGTQQAITSNGQRLLDLTGMSAPQFRFMTFWALMETLKMHGYIRAAMSVVGRSSVSAWWALKEDDAYIDKARLRAKNKLTAFYTRPDREWDNIKDYFDLPYNIMMAAQYLKYFGQAAFYLLRNEAGAPIGMEVLTGLVIPNVDDFGYFKKDAPAFVQYPTSNPAKRIFIMNPRDVVYIVNPDWEGHPWGSSDIDALSELTLPLDLYLMTAARNYMQNRDKPEVIYQLAPDIDDEAFDAFVDLIRKKNSGVDNIGSNPIAVKGELEIKELQKLPSDLPYQESRNDTRRELLAVAGVAGAKMGITDDMSSSNMREVRREFWETTMVPLFRFIEEAFYYQIHLREFKAPDWRFIFREPDFLTAVERATVHMRYKSMGALTANEIRGEIGYPYREDENGNLFQDQLDEAAQDIKGENQGSPPEGRPQEPDAPAQVGEPTNDDQDPVRGDNHDEEPKYIFRKSGLDLVRKELKQWQEFEFKRFGRMNRRLFDPKYIPVEVAVELQAAIDQASSEDELAEVFNYVFNLADEAVI